MNSPIPLFIPEALRPLISGLFGNLKTEAVLITALGEA
jgi:hypothetical protein